MDAKDYLHFLVQDIHTTVAATADCENLPVTCAVDMMDSDENGLYFLTAKGKSFYERLKKSGYLSLTGIKGDGTMSSTAVSVRGKVRELGREKVPELFDKNPYMYEIYPDENSRSAIRAFQIFEGWGEWFDLSKKPIERASFRFGGAKKMDTGYFVTDRCTGCLLCYDNCPQKCINRSGIPVIIQQNNCLHCGSCLEVCPARAIEKRGEL